MHPKFKSRRDDLVERLDAALREILGQRKFTEQESRDMAELKQFRFPGESLDVIPEEPLGEEDYCHGEGTGIKYGSSEVSSKIPSCNNSTVASSGVTDGSTTTTTSAPSSLLTNGSQSPNRKSGGDGKDDEHEGEERRPEALIAWKPSSLSA